jgi:hypothetical protein
MTLNQIRSWLYTLARLLGDVNAVQKGRVEQRIERRIAGRIAGRLLWRMLR